MNIPNFLRLSTFTVAAVIAASALASPDKVLPPSETDVGSYAGFAHWFAKKMVMDVDKTLGRLGIVAEVCTFRQFTPAKDFSYKGVGPCLTKNFTASMKTDQLAGKTYAWIKDPQTAQYHVVEIQWRPPQGGWTKIIKQYFAMKNEKAPKNASDPLPYQQFIGGDLKIILPEDPAALDIVTKNSPAWLKEQLATASSVSLHLEPTGRNAEKIVYEGKILLEQRPDDSGGKSTHVMTLKTDINVVILQRPFYVHGKYRKHADIPEMPTFTEQELK
jgi:hypothetical protein